MSRQSGQDKELRKRRCKRSCKACVWEGKKGEEASNVAPVLSLGG